MTTTENRVIIDGIDCTNYIDYDYLEDLFQKHLDWYLTSAQDVDGGVKWLSRFRVDNLYSKVREYVQQMRGKQLYLEKCKIK